LSRVSREGPLVLAMKGTRRARWSAAMLLIRSRRQHPATTCRLSRVVPHLLVQVRGRSWSSVAVDVGKGDLEPWALIGCVSARRAPDQVSLSIRLLKERRDHR
jgi:hypothetical protein